ncbi:hypothetical protein TWF694_000302 [Orbilia ellipsospora]|uniref:Pectate lyase domain-containing protein n=1 Tax=Orbilia ellipsospora TaxID=2528407 RepID=A0AAV9XUV0_9PEZI
MPSYKINFEVSVISSIISFVGLAFAACPDPTVNGFATGTTGGGGAAAVTVTTAADLIANAKASGSKVIVVKGTITANAAITATSNKTIRGIDENATIIGGFDIRDQANIIIKNLNIHVVGSVDGIASGTSTKIWYDHLNIWDASDGLLDTTLGSGYQTVSWCKFWYSSSSLDHRLASLLSSWGGSSNGPEDEGKLHVTYHHN